MTATLPTTVTHVDVTYLDGEAYEIGVRATTAYGNVVGLTHNHVAPSSAVEVARIPAHHLVEGARA